MSRRSQSRRRRTYGRRQHEVRERRAPSSASLEWGGELEPELREAWMVDAADDGGSAFGDTHAGLTR